MLDSEELTSIQDFINVCGKCTLNEGNNLTVGKRLEDTVSEGLLFNDPIMMATSRFRTENNPLRTVQGYIITNIINDDEHTSNYCVVSRNDVTNSMLFCFVNNETPYRVSPRLVSYKGYDVNEYFYKLFAALKAELNQIITDNQPANILISGFGIGGAIAQLSVIHLLNQKVDINMKGSILVATFGCPLTFTKQSGQLFKRTINTNPKIIFSNISLNGDPFTFAPFFSSQSKFYVKTRKRWGINWTYFVIHSIEYKQLAETIVIEPSFGAVSISDISMTIKKSFNIKSLTDFHFSFIATIGMYFTMLEKLRQQHSPTLPIIIQSKITTYDKECPQN